MNKEKNWIPTNKNIEEYKLLKSMLHSQKKEFDLLSKKKADGQLNHTKIRMVNRVLEPLKILFKNEETHEFLYTLNEDALPTNSDVVLIISQYDTAIDNFKDRYFVVDEDFIDDYGRPRRRWVTKEQPLGFYSNEEEEY